MNRSNLRRLNPEQARNLVEWKCQMQEWDEATFHEALKDAENGMWHNLPSLEMKNLIYGLVIGENKKAVERWANPPEFGDVVLFREIMATDCLCFSRLDSDTTHACEFLLENGSGGRQMLMPRNADVVTVPVEAMELLVMRYEEACDSGV